MPMYVKCTSCQAVNHVHVPRCICTICALAGWWKHKVNIFMKFSKCCCLAKWEVPFIPLIESRRSRCSPYACQTDAKNVGQGAWQWMGSNLHVVFEVWRPVYGWHTGIHFTTSRHPCEFFSCVNITLSHIEPRKAVQGGSDPGCPHSSCNPYRIFSML